MIALIKAFGAVNGAAVGLAGYLLSLAAYLGIYWLFPFNRNGRRFAAAVCVGAACSLVCDIYWLNYFFPGGTYHNHGLAGSTRIFYFPLLLLAALAVLTLINGIAASKPKRSKQTQKGKSGKRGIIIVIIILLLIAAPFIINACVRASAAPYIIEPEAAGGADCIIVLGAGVHDDGRPSDMLEDRLLCAIDLYTRGAAPKLLMSGDHGRVDYDEVNTMKRFAVERGVPDTDVFMDHAGFSTCETMYRARDIFKAQRVIIVTQSYHLYRAVYVANALGLDAHGVGSDIRVYAGQEYRDLRELLARVKDFFMVLLKPEPTYLGEAIPISGDGNLTNDQ